MSDRLINVDNLCTNPENHSAHICQLEQAGKTEELNKLQENPRFVCNNCGKKANEEGALCSPGPHHN